MHEILRSLYDQMMPLCDQMSVIASAVAGLGALLYITYRVWQSLARTEPIDLFSLLRPFAIGICIMLFQPLVLGTLNGVLSPIVQGTHRILEGQTFDMNEYQRQKDELERQNFAKEQNTSFLASDEEFDRQINELGWSPADLNTMQKMYEKQASFSLRSMVVDCFRWVLEVIFYAASLVLDTMRTFLLIVLSILGPLLFAISVYDGFHDTLLQWFGKYISVYLWLPISDLFGAILAKIQVLSLQKDMELMTSDPFYFLDSSNMVYLIFLIIGIIGYFKIPSIAEWLIRAGSVGGYNSSVSGTGSQIVNFVSGTAGAALGNAWGHAKGVFKK